MNTYSKHGWNRALRIVSKHYLWSYSKPLSQVCGRERRARKNDDAGGFSTRYQRRAISWKELYQKINSLKTSEERQDAWRMYKTGIRVFVERRCTQ